MTSAELLAVAQSLLIVGDVSAIKTHEQAREAALPVIRRLREMHPDCTRSKCQHAAMTAIGIAYNGKRPDIGGKRPGSGRKKGQKPVEAIEAHRKK